MCNCEWQIVTCPACKGDGLVEITTDFESNGFGGGTAWKTRITCDRCSGKRFIKVSLNGLNT